MGWDGWGRGGKVRSDDEKPPKAPAGRGGSSPKPAPEKVFEPPQSMMDAMQFPELSVTIITDDQTSMRGIRVSDMHHLIKVQVIHGKPFWRINDPECPQHGVFINPDHIVAIRVNKEK